MEIQTTPRQITFLWLLIPLILISSCKNEEAEPSLLETLSNVTVKFESDTQFIVADGTSAVNFTIEILDSHGDIIPDLVNRSTIKSGSRIVSNGLDHYSFAPQESGEYYFQLLIDDLVVQDKYIQASAHRKVEIPVIFHIPDDESNNASEAVTEILDRLNEKFNSPDHNRAVRNAVQPYIYFKLVEHNLDGTPLDEIGVNRYPAENKLLSNRFQEDWLKDYYWNPDYVVNIWLGKPEGSYLSILGVSAQSHLAHDRPRWLHISGASPFDIRLYKIEFGDTPPTHRIEGIRMSYRDNINDITLPPQALGRFMGLNYIGEGSVQDSYNFMSYTNENPGDHFTIAQNGRMWFTIGYSRWRARKGMILSDID